LHAEPRVPGRYQPEHRDQDEQQREDRDEGGVRQVGDEHAAVVIAVLLHDADDECRRPEALLRAIDLPDQPLRGVHANPTTHRAQNMPVSDSVLRHW
jgi:hypothetical protein